MGEEHEAELFFHCSEHCRVDAVAEGFLIERDGIVLRLTLPPSGAAEIYRGNLSPVAGWISRGFDRRQPTSTIVWQYGQAGVAGSGFGQLNTPVQVTFLPNKHLLITDQGNQRVIEVDQIRRIVWQYGTTGVSGEPGKA